jgi:hypothetical protein
MMRTSTPNIALIEDLGGMTGTYDSPKRSIFARAVRDGKTNERGSNHF